MINIPKLLNRLMAKLVKTAAVKIATFEEMWKLAKSSNLSIKTQICKSEKNLTKKVKTVKYDKKNC